MYMFLFNCIYIILYLKFFVKSSYGFFSSISIYNTKSLIKRLYLYKHFILTPSLIYYTHFINLITQFYLYRNAFCKILFVNIFMVDVIIVFDSKYFIISSNIS